MEAIVGLGSDLGDRMFELRAALDLLSRHSSKMQWSRVYSGPGRGFERPTDFLNAAVWLETDLTPLELLQCCLNHELERGRKRTVPGYQSRPIDLDLIYCGELVVRQPDLVLPHPRRLERRFVLQPTADVAPEFIDPLEMKSIAALLSVCADQEPLVAYPEML